MLFPKYRAVGINTVNAQRWPSFAASVLFERASPYLCERKAESTSKAQTSVAATPYSRYAPDTQPSPTTGVWYANKTAAPVVPHCKKAAIKVAWASMEAG